jgi:prepilin-type processing-associated H-X9-DG protein
VEARYQPRLIDVARDEGVTITFHDGHVARFGLARLRAACPCAECRGRRERGEPAWPRSGSPARLRIEDAHRHGAWGILLVWNDGHATGIFPFRSLRDWDEGDAPFAPDSGLGGGGPPPGG